MIPIRARKSRQNVGVTNQKSEWQLGGPPESKPNHAEIGPEWGLGVSPAKKKLKAFLNQKNPRVRKIRVRNSGAGNGCANFMDTWKNAFFLQEKPCP